MKIISITFLSILLICCNKSNENDNLKKKSSKIENISICDTIEFYCDSTNFGAKTKSKIDIYKIVTNQNTFIKLFLYKKDNRLWVLNDSLKVDGDFINKLNCEISDFNNDNSNDLLFVSGTAARGGNVIQTLVLYSNEKLKWIKNSENYPNLMYNKKLDCIDAFILTGGNTTCFLKIENDSLTEFARVEQRDKLITSEVLEKNGKWKELSKVKDYSEDMKRFINYNPLQERE